MKKTNPIKIQKNDIYKHIERKGNFVQLNTKIGEFNKLPQWIQVLSNEVLIS